jgi:hypothetical protein
MSVVNLFVIGVKKAGTSWLYYLLDQHPDIFMSRVKELYFFGEHYPERLDDYHRHFPFDASYTYFGEATVTYFRHAHIAREIKAYSPEAKVLAIVRDPVERLLSQFRYHKQLGVLPEDATLHDVFADDAFRMLEDSHYETTLPAYRDVFGDPQFRIISLEEATAEPEAFWVDLQAFLDIEAVPLPDLNARPKNPTGSATFRRLYRSTVHPLKQRYPGVYERMLESTIVQWAKQQLLHVLGTAEKEVLSPDQHAALRRAFAPTYAYLDRLGFTAYQTAASAPGGS